MSRRAHFLEALLFPSTASLALYVVGRPAPVATALQGAFDSATRNKGLLGRDRLDEGAALVIAPCSLIHTFGMQFPIDVVYAARDGRVLKLRRALRASRISGAFGAFAVIEMPAGAIDRAGLAVGDRLAVS
jgi:uncharacterized membrane protein (UPF0127 family)